MLFTKIRVFRVYLFKKIDLIYFSVLKTFLLHNTFNVPIYIQYTNII